MNCKSTTATRTSAFIVASLMTVLATGAESAEAGPIVLDQQYAPLVGTGLNVQNTQSLTQTFTVGLAGILSSVEVLIARGSPAPAEGITLSIIDATGGAPSFSTVLASAFINPSQVGTSYGYVPVDLSAAMLNVAVGQQLGIYLASLAPNGSGINPYAWLGDLTGAYAGGAGYINTSGAATTRDYGFRTYVDTQQFQAVPEPASVTLLGLGFATLAFRLAKRRSTRK